MNEPVRIALAQDRGITVVSAEDADLATYPYRCQIMMSRKGATNYARLSKTSEDGWNSYILLHRLVANRMGLATGGHIDHIDGDGLNNRRDNLRFATPAQNRGNVSKYSTNTSGYKGVTKVNRTEARRWMSQINCPGRGHVYLGRHETPEAAARVYDEWAREAYGEFARLNFPEGS